MIFGLKRSIVLRWLFDPVLLFILRWSCSTFACTLNSWTSKTCSAPLKDPVFSKVFKTLFNSSEEPNLSRCSRLVLAGPTAHDGWPPVKVTCRLSKLKESEVVLVSSYWDHCQLFVPASSSLDKLPEKKTNIFPLQIWIDVTKIADCHLDPETRTIWSSTPWSTSSGILSSPRWFKAHSVPSTSTWELWSF